MISNRQVRKYCAEDISKIENYEQAVASPDKWDCHHRLEIAADGTCTPVDVLIQNNVYYRRPACELVFLHHAEHKRMHNVNDRQRALKIGRTMTGRPAPWNRVTPSEATRKKLSEALKGRPHTPEHNAKVAASLRGKPGSHAPKSEAAKAAVKEKKMLMAAYKKYRAAGGPLLWNDWARNVWCRRVTSEAPAAVL